MTISVYGDMSQRTAVHAMGDMLDYAHPKTVLSKFGQRQPIPKNKSETVKFRRPVPFTVSTVPLQEGVTPTAHGISWQDVAATLKEYGDLAALTNKIEDLSEDPVLKTMSKLSGENAGATIEQVIYGAVKAGTSVFYANGNARNAVNTTVSLNKLRAVSRFLNAQKAKPMTEILSPGMQIGTSSIEAAYIAVAHTDIAADIRNLAGFTKVADYANRKPIDPNELGSVEDFRFILSPDLAPFADAGGTPGSTVISTTGSAADVYPILFFGEDAYGLCPLKGEEAIHPTVINPGKVDKSDPLGQRGFVGWRSWFTAVRLNESWMARLEVGAGAL